MDSAYSIIVIDPGDDDNDWVMLRRALILAASCLLTVALAGCSPPSSEDEGVGDELAETEGESSESEDGSSSEGSSSSNDEAGPDDDGWGLTGVEESTESEEETETETGPPIELPTEACEAIVAGWESCEIDGPGDLDYCMFVVEDHPATGEFLDCADAMFARFSCYAALDCEAMAECSLWGCLGEDPCPEEAAAVEAACVRTGCEQYFDTGIACGEPLPSVTEPGYCNYLAALDALVADDPDVCMDAFDDRAGCYAAQDCATFEQCFFGDSCNGGLNPCPDEQAAVEQGC